MYEHPRVLDSLPGHGAAPSKQAEHRVRVEGLVRRPLELSPADLRGLPQTTLVGDFACKEGWVVPGLRWSGVLVSELLEAAGALDGGRHVEFAADGLRFTLPVEEARGALLALQLDDLPLSRAHGGPSRLVVPDAACFTSIKWLDRITVGRAPGANTAQQIALERLARMAEGAPGVTNAATAALAVTADPLESHNRTETARGCSRMNRATGGGRTIAVDLFRYHPEPEPWPILPAVGSAVQRRPGHPRHTQLPQSLFQPGRGRSEKALA